MNLDDVARKAGVSAATVSRVINGVPGIAEKTAALVRSAIKDVGYVPPPPEKRNRKRKNFPPGFKHGKIGFFVPDSRAGAAQTQLTGLMLDGISSVVGSKKIDLQFLKLDPDGSVPSNIVEDRLDGVICKNWPKADEVIRRVATCNPVWCLGSPVPPDAGDRVEVDSESVAHLIAGYLADKGCDRLEIVDSQSSELSQCARANAIKNCAALTHMPVREHHVNSAQIETIDAAVSALSKAADGTVAKPAIILESAEFLYMPVSMALQQRGLQPGRDVEFICIAPAVDALPGLGPKVAVIDLSMRDVGACAAEMLLWRLANPDAAKRRMLIQPTIKGGR